MQVSSARGLGHKWSGFQKGKEALELQERLMGTSLECVGKKGDEESNN
jgi:hypothetical protein